MQNNNRSTWIIGLIVLVLLVLAGVMAFSSPSDEETSNTEEPTGEFENVSGDDANSIIVRDQIPGNVVFYENLTLEDDGFVVVRSEGDGAPGDVIGVMFVEAGENMSGNIELDSQTVEGGLYYVELYTDTDGDGVFDEGDDAPVVTTGGDEVRVRIETTEDLPERKG